MNSFVINIIQMLFKTAKVTSRRQQITEGHVLNIDLKVEELFLWSDCERRLWISGVC